MLAHWIAAAEGSPYWAPEVLGTYQDDTNDFGLGLVEIRCAVFVIRVITKAEPITPGNIAPVPDSISSRLLAKGNNTAKWTILCQLVTPGLILVLPFVNYCVFLGYPWTSPEFLLANAAVMLLGIDGMEWESSKSGCDGVRSSPIIPTGWRRRLFMLNF